MTSEATTKRVQEINNQTRRTIVGQAAIITPAVAALGPEAVRRIVQTIQTYDDFNFRDDPHGIQDFGAFEDAGELIVFNIEAIDVDLTTHSPDASDSEVTRRVPIIMLAAEA